MARILGSGLSRIKEGFSSMDERTLMLLEFDKILAMLSSHARTALGKELALSLKPLMDVEAVKKKLGETTLVRRWLERYGSPPLSAIRDVRTKLSSARSGAALEPGELLAIAGTLLAAFEVKVELESKSELPEVLANLSMRIHDMKWLITRIRKCIDEKGDVTDDASPRLRQVRARIRSLRESILSKLHTMISDPQIRAALQEPIVTIRSGRYCIPVKSSSRHAVKGVVHDKSSSELTLFVEPEEVVWLGNELRESQLDEEREVQRVLRSLTDDVVNSMGDIEDTLRAIAEIDLLFALAELSLTMKCVEPDVHSDGATVLIGARHPLLGDSAIPIDVHVGGDFDVLVITGPNMGGKTVTLKTIGLLTLMAQSGMHIPAKEGSRIRIFEKVFADIGEEQSIERSLSTFSSHILNIVAMIGQADSKSLILLDELGAGTDPDEGAALAKAILKKLQQSGATVVCTTHLGELKAFAHAQPRFMNASMQFDLQTLKPTYKVLMGIPGASYAFIIASRLGMPMDVIKEAEQMRASSMADLERALRKVEEERQRLSEELALVKRQRQELQELMKCYEEELHRLEGERNRILKEAREQALSIVERSENEVEAILKEMRKQVRESVVTERLRKRLVELKGELAPTAGDATKAAHMPKVGELVFMPKTRAHGVVVDVKGDAGRVLVDVDGVRMWIPLDEVQVGRSEVEGGQPIAAAAMMVRKMLSVPKELNIIGKTVEEALPLVDKFLDDAFLAGHEVVRIVHGKGSGRLRQAVHDLLKAHVHVESFEPAPPNEGGMGATIVKLKVV